jgi:NitT/TauT family transport system substrate-binding protein
MASVPDWTAIVMGQNKKVKIFPADEHFKSMSQVVLASDKTIAANPQLVWKLVRATLKGLEAIKADPVAAADDYVKAVAQWKGKEGAIIGTFKLYNQLVYPGQEKTGLVDVERLTALQEFYFKEGFIREKTPVDQLYTNQFVE